ncbi:MAG: hypothetical protein C4346_03915, partial [Chloroflexota bacterium]
MDAVSTGAVRISLIPYLTERGDGAAFAAVSAGLIGAAQVGARVVATLAGGRLSPVALTALVFGMQAIAVAKLVGWQAHSGVLVSFLVMGAANGVVTLMRAGLVAEFWGSARWRDQRHARALPDRRSGRGASRGGHSLNSGRGLSAGADGDDRRLHAG